MTFFVVYLLAMTVPGAALAALLGLNSCRAVLAVALSLLILLLALVGARALGAGPEGLAYLLIGLYAVLGGVGVWSRRRRSVDLSIRGRVDGVCAVPVLTLAAVAAYMLWAGPYTEIPGDPWWHIARINDRLSAYLEGSIGGLGSLETIFSKNAAYWYTIVAVLLGFAGTSLQAALGPLAAANTLLFSAAVYAFALYVFQPVVPDRPRRHAIAAAAVFFFLSHFGISVFSYVRYYVYGPTFLNYVVYLAAVACVLRFVREEEGAWRFLVVAVVLAVAAAMMHVQEAVFIVTMSGAIVLVEFLRRWPAGDETEPGLRRVTLLFAWGVALYLLLHGWAYTSLVRHNPLSHGVLADIRSYLPFLQNLYVLKPTYQFYQVVTVWGVAVYVLFLFRRRELSRSSYLVAGMAMPVLTVFNPVFTDLFLRFSWPEVLWRMCYMLPLPFVGGYVLVNALAGSVSSTGVARKLGSAAIAAGLVFLLLPINTTFFVSPHSRIYTLAPVAPENDHRLWGDLLEFLGTVDQARVITDPVTGYVINGLTFHRYSGYKFYGMGAMPVDRDFYAVRSFRGRQGWIVVVNERDGAFSGTGHHGRHWSQDVMNVSEYYSPEFLEFVEGHPSIFTELWSTDGISVYRIQRSAEREKASGVSENNYQPYIGFRGRS